MRADVADQVVVQREDAAVRVEGHRRTNEQVAALVVADEGFAAVAGPLDRTADATRRPQHGNRFHVEGAARAEATAHIGRHHTDVLGRHAQRVGQAQLLACHALAAGDQQPAVLRRVVVADGGARLHLAVDDAAAAELAPHHAGSLGEGGVGGHAIAQLGLEAQVVRQVVVELGCTLREGIVAAHDGRQHLVIHAHGFGRIARLERGFGHHHHHRFADVAHLVGG
ncbi:hypothetical protein FQZ97_839450 [compost metagenome]